MNFWLAIKNRIKIDIIFNIFACKYVIFVKRTTFNTRLIFRQGYPVYFRSYKITKWCDINKKSGSVNACKWNIKVQNIGHINCSEINKDLRLSLEIGFIKVDPLIDCLANCSIFTDLEVGF